MSVELITYVWYNVITVKETNKSNKKGGNEMDVLVYNEMPKGWSALNGALTAPEGFVWIWNGKSRFGNGKNFQHWLLRQSNRDF